MPFGKTILLLLSISAGACQITPPHPRSDLPYHAPDLVEWIWSGSTTSTSSVVKARLTERATEAILRVFPKAEPNQVLSFAPSHWNESFRIAEFQIQGLSPDTQYEYQLQSKDHREEFRNGSFRTFPDQSSSFLVAFGNCAQTGSTGLVFETIQKHHPLLFLHLGDFHYGNIRETEPGAYLQMLSYVLASPSQSALYRSLPIAYMWDDHDYGPDNSDRTQPGRAASRAAYQLAVPHYPLPAGSGDVPIYQSFDIGRVHFIVTDNRSERHPPSQPSPRSMLGARQKSWFKNELLEASKRAWLIVWVNSVPWIEASGGGDGWGGFPQEREELARFFSRKEIRPLIILGGDAHMMAIDDGSHSRYAPGQPEIPVFHAASLDRPGSLKGGPYSEGAIPGGGFFGLMNVRETESALDIEWSGRDWRDAEIMRYHFSVSKKLP